VKLNAKVGRVTGREVRMRFEYGPFLELLDLQDIKILFLEDKADHIRGWIKKKPVKKELLLPQVLESCIEKIGGLTFRIITHYKPFEEHYISIIDVCYIENGA